MPPIDLTNAELAAVTALLRRAVEQDKFPHAPRLDLLRSALAKLEAPPKLTPDTTAEDAAANSRRKAGEALGLAAFRHRSPPWSTHAPHRLARMQGEDS
jgi:hypothetical protein